MFKISRLENQRKSHFKGSKNNFKKLNGKKGKNVQKLKNEKYSWMNKNFLLEDKVLDSGMNGIEWMGWMEWNIMNEWDE